MSDYEFSVVTPCHNVNIVLLKKAFETLKNQKFPFDKIEWVLVIHNCIEKNAVEIESLADGYANVKTFRLQNDIHSASSPRNCGLDNATGKYIAFLDADDFYELNTFEVAYNHLLETKAEIAAFRYMVLKEDPDVPTDIHPLTYLDQTKECIVAEHDSWDGSQFIHGEAMNIYSKIFLRSFLNEHKIRFNEEIPYAEDGDFCLQAYGHAKKICFLPQLIGYAYCRYTDSMTSSLKRPPEVILKHANGFKKVFDTGLGLKQYMNTYMWDLTGYMSAILIMSMDTTYAQRKEVKKILWPYVKTLKPIEPCKVYSQVKIKLVQSTVNIVLKHPLLIHIFITLLRKMKIDLQSKMNLRHKKD